MRNNNIPARSELFVPHWVLVFLIFASGSAYGDVDLGSTVLGIHGGDSQTRGIHGGDSQTRGIHGGDSQTRVSTGDETQLFDSAAMGPIESIEILDDGSYLITVLGQAFVGDKPPGSVNEGAYVLAAGSGGAMEVFMPLGSIYVPGASSILVRGVVDLVEPSTAVLQSEIWQSITRQVWLPTQVLIPILAR